MNDAPALAMANVGISMGVSGSAVAMETSHITLMSNDIRKIPKVIRLSRRTHRKIIVNIIFSLITKVAILGLAVGGHPILWAAVLADVGTCLLVILNSMTLLPSNKKKAKKCCHKSNHQGPTCGHKCSSGPCGSNSVGCHGGHGCHKNESTDDKKPCCKSSSGRKECRAESSAQCCQGNTRYEHLISMNSAEDSHRDNESCLNHSKRHTKHTVSCHKSHFHKSREEKEHLISPCSHEEHKEHSSCEGHSRRMSDHCHHESLRHEDESTHRHSHQEITCDSKTEITKSCCNTCVDPTTGAKANLIASTIYSGSEKQNTDSCCGSERGECHRKDECSNLQASKRKDIGGCCRSYRKECSRRVNCCGNGMMKVPEIIIE